LRFGVILHKKITALLADLQTIYANIFLLRRHNTPATKNRKQKQNMQCFLIA